MLVNAQFSSLMQNSTLKKELIIIIIITIIIIIIIIIMMMTIIIIIIIILQMSVFRVFLVRVFLYSIRMRENTYQKNSLYGHFPRCV